MMAELWPRQLLEPPPSIPLFAARVSAVAATDFGEVDCTSYSEPHLGPQQKAWEVRVVDHRTGSRSVG